MTMRKNRTAPILILAVIAALAVCLAAGPVLSATEKAKTPAATTKAKPQPAPTKAKQPWAVWNYAKEKPVRGGYFRTAGTLDVGLLNPNHWPVNDWLVINFFFEKLLVTDGNYRPVAWMIESWTYPDPLTCITKLHKGITFTDGSPLDAAAVKYVIDYINDKKNGCWSRAWIADLDSVEAVDELTLKWKTKKPWAAFLGIINNVPGYMISPNILKQDTRGNFISDTTPVGTGQWILEERNPGNFIKVKRNPNWWYGKSIGYPDMPYFDGRIQYIIPDPSVQLANLRSGKIHSMSVAKASYSQVKDDHNLQLVIGPLNWLTAQRFNLAKGPCQDIRVRKAISMAIDRKALITGTQFGLGRIASCMYPDDHWAHNPNLKPVKYDPEMAKKLLSEAGFPNGLTVKGYMVNVPTVVTVAEAMKAMLAKVGVTWEVETLDPVAISDKMKNLEYDFAGGGWSWIYDPDLMATGLYHPDGGFNYGRTNNPEAIKLIEAGRVEVDLVKRQKIYWNLEKVLYDNYEDAWLWWEMSISAYSKNVRGLDSEMSIRHKEIFSWSHPLWFKDGKE